MNQSKNIFIAAGGTGGHLYPAIAVADAIQKTNPNLKIFFVGSPHGIESRILSKYNYPLLLVPIGGLNQTRFINKLFVILQMPIAFLKSLFFIIKYNPQFVFGFGGYTSGPVVLIASLLGRKTAIFESNAIPGKTNQILSKFVQMSFTTFSDSKKLLSSETKEIGFPVRNEMNSAEIVGEDKVKAEETSDDVASADKIAKTLDDVASADKIAKTLDDVASVNKIAKTSDDQSKIDWAEKVSDNEEIDSLAKNSKKFKVLVFGGSQGARGINMAVTQAALEGSDWLAGVDLIHQTGKLDFHEVKKRYHGVGLNGGSYQEEKSITVLEYLDPIKHFYDWADFIICRAGASTIAELSACGKAALLIPFPFATDQHQQKNAEALVAKNAALMCIQKDFTPEFLKNTIMKFKNQKNLLKQYEANIRQFHKPDAAHKMAKYVNDQVTK